MKSLIILGSTGSIGTQCLSIVALHRDRFSVSCLCCGKRIGLLREQIEAFSPKTVVVADEKDAEDLRREYPALTVLCGDEGLCEAARGEGDLVVNALVGIRGLAPTLAAIEAGKDIALANKETLVTGGAKTFFTVKRNVIVSKIIKRNRINSVFFVPCRQII